MCSAPYDDTNNSYVPQNVMMKPFLPTSDVDEVQFDMRESKFPRFHQVLNCNVNTYLQVFESWKPFPM